MDITQLPKGALPDPSDTRDFKIETLGALPPVDWSKGSGLQRAPTSDQGTSDACGPHATTKYHWQLKRKNYSIRDLSARVLYPDYGSTARDNIMAVVNQGQATLDEVSDPLHETPQNMRDKTGVTLDKELDDRELNGFVIPASDIETVARAIAAYQGVIFGVTGSNPGWTDLTNPRPPKIGEATWGHLLYANDFHIHSGQKCIICPTSWNKSCTEHHIRENYFITGFTFNPWTLIPKGQTMDNIVIYKNGSEYQLAHKAKSEEGLAQQLFDAGAVNLLTTDGKPDFAKIDQIAHVL